VKARRISRSWNLRSSRPQGEDEALIESKMKREVAQVKEKGPKETCCQEHDGAPWETTESLNDLIVLRKPASIYDPSCLAILDSLFVCSSRNSHPATSDNLLAPSWKIQ
jgi:hypothetical protein